MVGLIQAGALSRVPRSREVGRKYDGQRDADHRGHHQPALALRLDVMHAVEQEDDPFLAGAARAEMEDEAVQHVLGKRPHEQPGQVPGRHDERTGAGQLGSDGAGEENQDDREPDGHDHGRVDVGEKLQEIRLEQADRFLILDDRKMIAVHAPGPFRRIGCALLLNRL